MLTLTLLAALAFPASADSIDVIIYGDQTCAALTVAWDLGPDDRCREGDDADVPHGMNPNQTSRISIVKM